MKAQLASTCPLNARSPKRSRGRPKHSIRACSALGLKRLRASAEIEGLDGVPRVVDVAGPIDGQTAASRRGGQRDRPAEAAKVIHLGDVGALPAVGRGERIATELGCCVEGACDQQIPGVVQHGGGGDVCASRVDLEVPR